MISEEYMANLCWVTVQEFSPTMRNPQEPWKCNGLYRIRGVERYLLGITENVSQDTRSKDLQPRSVSKCGQQGTTQHLKAK